MQCNIQGQKCGILYTIKQNTLEKCRHCGASLSEFADVAHGRAYAAVQTYMYVDVRTYANSARNPRALLRCRASRWAVDCAARRALSLTLRLTSRAFLFSVLSKAPFLRSRSLLRL